MSILKSISFGFKFFEMAKVLREAILINGMLTNAEVWYSLGKSEISQLEQVDHIFLRKLFAAPSSVSIEILYLEMGIIPISILLKSRRVMYLHYLANLSEDDMLHKMFLTQWKYPVRGDWTEQTKQDLKDLDIQISLDQLKSKSKGSFKRFLKKKTQEFAFTHLMNLKDKHSKMKNLNYKKLSIQKYLKDEKMSVNEAQILFMFRTRSAQFKCNMRSQYTDLSCMFCSLGEDSQPHSFDCEKMKTEIQIKGKYEDIFLEKIPTNTVKTLVHILKFRENQPF